MKVIAVSGWKGSGKDTVANYLVKEFGYRRVAFADVLKEMVAQQYDIPVEHCHESEHKESPLYKYPVESTDAFTSKIHEILDGEFAEVETKHVDKSTFQKYWTPRSLCILEGSIKRSVTSKYWVATTIKTITDAVKDYELALKTGAEYFVISDLRYKSEIVQLRQAFGEDLITVRVNRFDNPASLDASERDLDNAKFDLVMNNQDCTLEDLYNKIDTELMGRP